MELIVDFETRINNKSATKIDIVITNNKTNMTCNPIHGEEILDHKTIKIDIQNRK